MQHSLKIATAINASPLNRGLEGADWVCDGRNIAHVEGPDIVLFDYDSPGIYEIHVLLASRGQAAAECIGRALGMMFRDRGAEVIFGMVPEHRRDVKIMARWCGLQFIQKLNLRGDAVELFEISRDRWSTRA